MNNNNINSAIQKRKELNRLAAMTRPKRSNAVSETYSPMVNKVLNALINYSQERVVIQNRQNSAKMPELKRQFYKKYKNKIPIIYEKFSKKRGNVTRENATTRRMNTAYMTLSIGEVLPRFFNNKVYKPVTRTRRANAIPFSIPKNYMK